VSKKKTKKDARIVELRDALVAIAEARSVLATEAKGLKKKARRQADEEDAKLKKAAKKAFHELDNLAPGRFDVSGWDLDRGITREDVEAGERAVLGKSLAEHQAEAESQVEVTLEDGVTAILTPPQGEPEERKLTPAAERHLAHLARVQELHDRIAELKAYLADESHKKKARKTAEESLAAAEAELEQVRADGQKLVEDAAARQTVANGLKGWTPPKMRGDETDEELKARVQAKRAAREAGVIVGKVVTETMADGTVKTVDENGDELRGGVTEEQAEAIHPEDLPLKKKGKKAKAVTQEAPAVLPEMDGTLVAEEKVLEDIEPTLRRDRWDRPIILTPEGKEKGYRRVTTFIDVIEDKTTLVDWKQRVVVVGVAAIEQAAAGVPELVGIEEVTHESVLQRVEAANVVFAAGMKTAKKKLKKGAIDAKAYDDLVARIEKDQKAELNDLVAEAFRAGDGFLKAEAGTRLHYLAECVDKGEPLPEDTTDLERRDLAALADAFRQLELKVLDVERFVVHDGYKAGGTLDRRVSYVSPSLGRRVVAIGDIKTGRMDFGAAKMARQCALYGSAKGYDPTKPEERVNLRCNQEVALIFHLPAGSGVCTVYELDLKLAHKGLRLCQAIYDHRAETSTLKKVTAAGDGKGIAVGKGE